MRTIKLADGTQLSAIGVNSTTRYFQGANRDTMEFIFSKSEKDFTNIDLLFSDKAKTGSIIIVEQITTTDESGTTVAIDQAYQYADYIIKVGMSQRYITDPIAGQALPEEVITVTMAQLTYIEKQLAALGISL